jgi:hypothetical protein
MRIGVGINLARVGVLGGDFGVGLGPGGLGVQAAAYLGGIEPYHYADFITNRMLYAGADVGNVTQATGYSFSRASTGYYTNADGTLTSFASGALRRGDRGVLIEGARTNLALWSRDFTNAAWVKVNVTPALDQIGVDGTANSASSLTATAGLGTALQTVISTSAARATTCYVKRITGTGAIEFTSDGIAYTDITSSLSTGSWFRALVTGTITNPVIGFRITTSGDAIAVDFAGLESAAFPSSPIVTVAAAATRAADVLTYTVNTTAQIQAAVASQPEATKGAWTQVTATATISGEDVSLSGGAGFPAAGRSITGLTVGNWYAASVNVTAVSGNQSFEYRNSATPGGGSRVVAQPFNTTGVKVLLFRAEAGNNIEVRGDGGTSTVSFTSLSVKEVPANSLTLYPLSLWAEFERAIDSGGAETVVAMNAPRAEIGVSGGDIIEAFLSASPNSGYATVSGAVSVGSVTKTVVRFAENDVRAARAGTLSSADTSVSAASSPSTLQIGARADGAGSQLFGYIRRAAIFNSALTDAQLQTVST